MDSNNLQLQINKARAEIRTDGYSMSIGEWMNIYQSLEMDIHPEFQRLFRWTDEQKSRLIESILLGIPIPPIFVAQRENGIWDVVDGLQRLSTIFQFTGILLNEDREKVEPLILKQTKYLPALAGKKWDDPNDLVNSFTVDQRLLIKRSKIDVSIILRESDTKSKYELFQRLNTGGSPLSDQEVRNAIMIMINRDMYLFIKRISELEAFQNVISLTDRAIEEKYDMDLALRFVLFREITNEDLSNIGDINEYITDRMVEKAEAGDINFELEEKVFTDVFQTLNEVLGSDSMKKYNHEKGKFMGGFLLSAFEVVAIGLGANYSNLENIQSSLVDKIKNIWANHVFTRSSGSGVRANTRIPKTISLGREIFANNESNN